MDGSYADRYRGIDFRKHPELYPIGRGEQGVLIAEPYKSELLPLWRFRTEEVARESAELLHARFIRYLHENDFVGADMARKFLQMGFTRARRYANHAGGRKYASNPQRAASAGEARKLRAAPLPQREDWATNEKARAAEAFRKAYDLARTDSRYRDMAARHRALQEASG